MLRSIALLAFLCHVAAGSSSAAQSSLVNTLIPQPSELQASVGPGLALSRTTSIFLQASTNAPLRAATSRFIVRLQSTTSLELTTPLASTQDAASIVIHVADASASQPALGMDESYSLNVDSHRATIEANTVFGAYHGMETLLQLLQSNDSGWFLPSVHLVDTPRFPWRGLLLDPSRHFLPVPVLLRNLDAMAAVKMNVLHLHLTDFQGFRIESKVFPRLTADGSDGEFYTQDQMRAVVAYAAARGIRIVPEFDMPGHSMSWMAGYPQLASAPGPFHAEHSYHIFAAAMDPTRASTYEFLDRFFEEMTHIFPDQYVHIGGDETNGVAWKSNPRIAAYMTAHGYAKPSELQAEFSRRVQRILNRHGRKMIGWDEALSPDLLPGFVVQNRRGATSFAAATTQNRQTIYSQPYYLDHHSSSAEIYKAKLPTGQGMLGGEACMWSEEVNAQTIDSRIWPRTIAFAERMWSPPQVSDVVDMYRRLRVESLRLDAMGLEHLSNPQQLLRQISGSISSPELETLAATLQPEDFIVRLQRQKPTRDTPLVGLVDAVVFDPPLEHELDGAVDTFLHSTDAAEINQAASTLRRDFQSWVNTGPALDQLAESNPELKKVTERRHELVALGHLGLEALEAREHHEHLSAADVAMAEQLLQRAATSDEGYVDFIILQPLEQLLRAVR
jgi:hexosaminidase